MVANLSHGHAGHGQVGLLAVQNQKKHHMGGRLHESQQVNAVIE